MKRLSACGVAVLACLPGFLGGLSWGLPLPFDVSPDALPVLRSLHTVANFANGGAGYDKYPQGHHLLAGAVEKAVLVLGSNESERARLDQLREDLARRQSQKELPSFGAVVLNEGRPLAATLSRLTRAGRLLSVALGLLAVAATTWLLSSWLSPTAGLLGGILFGLQPAVVHYAATLNVDLPYLAWSILAIGSAAALARNRSTASAIALGAFMALAAATKDQAAGLFPGLIATVFLAPTRLPRARMRELGIVAAAAAVVYTATSGLLHPDSFREHLRFVFGEGSEGYRIRAGVLALLTETARMLWVAAGPPACLLGIAGLIVISVRRRGWVLALPAVAYVLCFLIPADYVYPRFVMPIGWAAAISGAFFIHALSVALRRRLANRRARQATTVIAVAIVLGVMIPGAWDVVKLKNNDPRRAAVASLQQQRSPEQKVWIVPRQYFAAPYPLPGLPSEVITEDRIGELPPGDWLLYSIFLPRNTPIPVPAVGDQHFGGRIVGVFAPDETSTFGRWVEIQPLVLLIRLGG